MTSGAGIAHAEQTPQDNSGRLDGVQLWVALPDRHRHTKPGFDQQRQVPVVESAAGLVRVFAGAFDRVQSTAAYYSDLSGFDLEIHPKGDLEVPLNAQYEYGVLVMSGDCTLNGEQLGQRLLYYLGTTRSSATFSSQRGGRVLVVGGVPFDESILMWWNFVARTPEEIAEARADWEEERRFGTVASYKGLRLPAPALTRLARPNPVS
jgi:redox-sensitive bicupin YhaK (pirin superfamily)